MNVRTATRPVGRAATALAALALLAACSTDTVSAPPEQPTEGPSIQRSAARQAEVTQKSRARAAAPAQGSAPRAAHAAPSGS